jgi:threonine aldolase
MVFIEVPVERLDALRVAMDAAQIRLSIGYTPAIRLVTHLDVDDEGVARTVQALRDFTSR